MLSASEHSLFLSLFLPFPHPSLPPFPFSLLSIGRRYKIRDASLGYPKQNKQAALCYSRLCVSKKGANRIKAGRQERTSPVPPSSRPKARHTSVEGRSQKGQGWMEGQEGRF